MNKKPSNPPVYPQAKPTYVVNESGQQIQDGSKTLYVGGMSLRDYFAGQVLAALMSEDAFDLDEPDDVVVKICAEAAYDFADAMLAEREKRFTDESEGGWI